MRKEINIVLLTIGILVWIFCHTAWLLFGKGTYYFGTAFIIFASAFVINSEAMNNESKKDSYHTIITNLFLFLSFNNLLDEVFFDPQAIEFNEYIVFILYLIYVACGKFFFRILNISSKV